VQVSSMVTTGGRHAPLHAALLARGEPRRTLPRQLTYG
jgi:hypothetical protein